jgi:hypothetical protein
MSNYNNLKPLPQHNSGGIPCPGRRITKMCTLMLRRTNRRAAAGSQFSMVLTSLSFVYRHRGSMPDPDCQ